MKKQTYKFEKEGAQFNRDNALNHYKNLLLLQKTTSELVNSYKKIGKPIGYLNALIKVVQDAKTSFKDCWKSETVYIRRVKDQELIRPYAGDLKYTLERLRQDLRQKRSERRDFGDMQVHHSFGYWMSRQLDKVYRSLSENKEPKDTNRYIGIEIECIVPTGSHLKKLMLPYAKYVSMVGDGSIDLSEFNRQSECNCNDPDDCNPENHSSNEYEDKEIRVLVKESELVPVLTKVCEVLNSIGAIVNKSCGLHVHFDMRDTTMEKRNEIHAKLFRALPLLTQIVPESRRNNQYCKRNKRALPNYRGSRYRMINATSYHKHSTFEIRLFNSTTNANKIINWITLLQNIMNGAVVLRSPSSFKHAQKHWKMSDDLMAWAEARKAKFNGSSQDSNETLVTEASEAILQEVA